MLLSFHSNTSPKPPPMRQPYSHNPPSAPLHPAPPSTQNTYMSTAPRPSSSPSPPPTPQSIYTALTTHLALHTHSTLEVEIFPSSYPLPSPSSSNSPLLIDGTCLALSKKSLIQAFLIARQILSSYLIGGEASKSDCARENRDDPHGLEAATKILLLYNPEHLTAANTRKRCLRSLLSPSSSSSTSTTPSAQGASALISERAFSTTLVTSPLPRHAKSPTLWSHRYWLLKTHLSFFLRPFPPFPRPTSSTATDDENSTTRQRYSQLLEEEITTVLQAAERHAANYHAFLYARRVILLLERERAGEGEELWYEGIRGRIVGTLHKWCLAHPGDISGWAFLTFLLDRSSSETENQIVETAIKRTESFVRDLDWRGESVQWFLQSMKRRRKGVQGECGIG